MRTRLFPAMRRAASMLLSHWLILVLVMVATVLWLAFGIAIGGAPFLFIVLVPIAALAFGTLAFIQYRRTANAQPERAPRDGLIVIGTIVAASLVVFGLIQLVPYGRPQQAGASTGEPQWATPQTRELMVRACFSCHSNQVEYPWYSQVAPISWTVQHHIDEGRDAVNYSTYTTDRGAAGDSVEVIREGSMPPGYFTRFGRHPEAKLTEAEKAELIAGLTQTPGMTDRNRSGESGDRRKPERD